MWALSLTVPLLALAFLIGIARWHLFLANAIQHLGGRLAEHPGPEDLQSALAETFDDPLLEIVYRERRRRSVDDRLWCGGRRADPGVGPLPHGGARRQPGRSPGSSTTRAWPTRRRSSTPRAPTRVLTLDNRRLGAEAAALLDEVRESRMRIQASADDERRRVERDLHDGAQQRLVALRIKLELAAERIDGSDGRERAADPRARGDVDGALDEIRSLARGIYPSPLADRGLVEALRSAALLAVLPVTVHAEGTRERYPRAIESAAYFCCLEAMQNAAKHARGRAHVLEVSPTTASCSSRCATTATASTSTRRGGRRAHEHARPARRRRRRAGRGVRARPRHPRDRPDPEPVAAALRPGAPGRRSPHPPLTPLSAPAP